MKALRCLAPHDVQIVEVPNPQPLQHDLLIKPIATGICGTDIEIIEGGVDPAFIRYPITLGHEWVGRVVATTNSASSILAGSRVVVEGMIPCTLCEECQNGATNRCETYDEIGFTRDGAAAEFISAPEHLAHVLSDNVSDESAALIEPAAVVFQGLTKLEIKSQAKILVVGDGTIGLLATAMLKKFTPAHVDVFGIRAEQREMVIKAGATRFITEVAELTNDYHYVIEAAGAIAAVELAISQGRRGAKVLLLGYPEQTARLQLGVHDLINRDLTIYASFSYTRHSWKAVVELLNSGAIDLTFIVTHRFGIEEWGHAIEVLRKATGQPRGKVLLTLNPH